MKKIVARTVVLAMVLFVIGLEQGRAQTKSLKEWLQLQHLSLLQGGVADAGAPAVQIGEVVPKGKQESGVTVEGALQG